MVKKKDKEIEESTKQKQNVSSQMELFGKSSIDTTELDKGVKDLQASRKMQFNNMTKMLTSGKVKDLSIEEKDKFVKLYKMLKQHHSFNDGGLLDEGGMIDEVSGNDVPSGSTREEVRDDIPAQLSEGEFVFPADVVRFVGLEKLMQMRQKAKEGLKKMEDMGQMGNSEEATIPDDVPFSMDDLDMEDDKEEEVSDSNFNRGGVVKMAEGGTTPTTENTDLNATTINESNLNPKQQDVPIRTSSNITPTTNTFTTQQTPTTTIQPPLNVRQQSVPTRGATKNIPSSAAFLKKKSPTTTTSLEDSIPSNLGSRFTTSNAEIIRQQSAEDIKKELDNILSINPYDNDNSSDTSGASFPNGIPQGGINYADTQRFELPDQARDVLNQFSKSQLRMFSVLNPLNNVFGTFASAVGAGLADVTNGLSAKILGGPIMTAERGKAEAIAFNTAMIDIQRDFGIKVGTPMHEWGEKAINQIGIRGEYALKTGAALHNARYNLPFESSLTEKEQSFMEKAKSKFSSIFGDEKKNATSNLIGTEEIDPTNAGFIGPMSYNNDRAYYDAIGELIAADIAAAKMSEEEGGITGFGFEDSSMAEDLTELGFSADTKDEISANGGSIGIKYNDNGQAYSVNDNGTFTHTDGTTVNFTDSKGNPGNAPSTPDPSPPPAPPPSRPSTPSNNNNSNENNDNPGGSDNSSGAGAESGVGGWT